MNSPQYPGNSPPYPSSSPLIANATDITESMRSGALADTGLARELDSELRGLTRQIRSLEDCTRIGAQLVHSGASVRIDFHGNGFYEWTLRNVDRLPERQREAILAILEPRPMTDDNVLVDLGIGAGFAASAARAESGADLRIPTGGARTPEAPQSSDLDSWAALIDAGIGDPMAPRK